MQTLTPEELHQQYAQTVAAYGALLPEPALRVAFAHQVDGYFRQYLLVPGRFRPRRPLLGGGYRRGPGRGLLSPRLLCRPAVL